jgi:hypothetical protein
MKATREDPFIKLFLSAYERGAWADAILAKPDAIDRINPAVDQIATRASDGMTLAVEHTIIEAFVGDKEDFAFFEAALLGIEKDESLVVQGRIIYVYVPVGTLRNQPQAIRDSIVKSVHAWIKSNRLNLPDGRSDHRCFIGETPGSPPFTITLTVKSVAIRRGSSSEPGHLNVRRQQVENNLDQVIEKALRRKLPKLVNTPADRRILLLERQHMNLLPESILDEINSQRTSFPQLANVDEIWILETMFYGTTFGGTHLRFELYKNGEVIRSLDFNEGKLTTRSEGGVGEVIYYE